MNILDYLPQTKYQLIGFTVWVVCHSIVQIWIGKMAQNRAALNKPEGEK